MPTSKASDQARDPRVDDYIAKAAPFARAPLAHIRDAMHTALPDATEAIKWGHPFFLLDGRPFANMAAFKAHCSLGFWRGGRPVAEEAAGEREKAMGQFGRIESVADLPKAAALRRQSGASKRYDAFTPSQQAEYVDWIVEAKRDATRASRIAQAVEWIAEGKTRNWKYQAC